MAYKLVYTKSSAKQIRKLDIVAKKRIKKKLELLKLKPTYYATRLTNKHTGQYRWRVGNYRIVFDINGKNIVVLKVGHRRDIYK